MRDFRHEVAARQGPTARDLQAEAAERTAATRDYNDFIDNMIAFNKGRTRIEAAPYLEDEARIALLGLLSSFRDANVEPERVYRGMTQRPYNFLKRNVYGEGWVVPRGYKTIRHGSGIAPMLVTPDGLMMPRHSATGGFDASSSTIAIPQQAIFTNPGVHYRSLFNTGIIVEAVISTLAERGIDWVDP